jgi:clan AA aspartic protease
VSIIKGNINKLYEAEISIEFPDKSHEIIVLIDTGFNGDLVLPLRIIDKLNLKSLYRMEVALVGETTKEVDFFRGQIKWLNDEILTVDVIADDSFLIGTNLLRHGKLWIDYQSNEVLITK